MPPASFISSTASLTVLRDSFPKGVYKEVGTPITIGFEDRVSAPYALKLLLNKNNMHRLAKKKSKTTSITT